MKLSKSGELVETQVLSVKALEVLESCLPVDGRLTVLLSHILHN